MEFVQDKYDVWKYPMSTWGAAISHFVIASPPTFLGCFFFSPILSISLYIFGYPQTALFLLFLFVKAQALLFQDGIKWLDLYNVEFIAASSVGWGAAAEFRSVDNFYDETTALEGGDMKDDDGGAHICHFYPQTRFFA